MQHVRSGKRLSDYEGMVEALMILSSPDEEICHFAKIVRDGDKATLEDWVKADHKLSAQERAVMPTRFGHLWEQSKVDEN